MSKGRILQALLLRLALCALTGCIPNSFTAEELAGKILRDGGRL